MIIITRLAFTMRCVLSHHHHCYSHLMVWMFALWFAFAVSAPADTEAELGEHNYWPYVKKAHDDGAHYQSPVDIITRFAERRYLPFLRTEGYWNFERADVVITNTGHTVCVRLANNTKAVPYIMGGPLLKHKYMFEQMHFHWGKDDHGSEHEINGHKYAMEVHIVHYRSDYGSFDKATKFDDGLSVVAFFGQIQAEDNPEFKTFATDLRHITQPDTAIDRIFMEEFSWLKNTALRQRYFTYEGSLTTEPYAECVIWIVFTETIGISRNQLAEFRHLRSHDGEMLVNGNDRDLQPFNNRTILYAF